MLGALASRGLARRHDVHAVGEGTFGIADAFRRNPIAGCRLGGLRRALRPSGRRSPPRLLDPEFTGARYLAVTDLGVYGRRADLAHRTRRSSAAPPRAVLASRDASFALAASDPGASFECRLDGAAWTACPGAAAYTGLTEGRHVFEARAADGAGNVDTSPAGRSWTVDVTAPETALLGGPPEGGRVRVRTATLTFAAEPGATFQCRIDGGEWRACATPLALASLALGRHVVEVRALDAVGNVDATPAVRAWRVAPTTASYTLTLPRLGRVAALALRVRYTCPNACRSSDADHAAAEVRRLRLGSGRARGGPGRRRAARPRAPAWRCCRSAGGWPASSSRRARRRSCSRWAGSRRPPKPRTIVLRALDD